MKFEFHNRMDIPVNISLEPIGDSFDIPPGSLGEIEFKDEFTPRFEVYSESQIIIWTEGHVTVTLGDTKMEFPSLT